MSQYYVSFKSFKFLVDSGRLAGGIDGFHNRLFWEWDLCRVVGLFENYVKKKLQSIWNFEADKKGKNLQSSQPRSEANNKKIIREKKYSTTQENLEDRTTRTGLLRWGDGVTLNG